MKTRMKPYLLPGLSGFLFYIYYFGFKSLNPLNVNWLLPYWNGNADPATNYLGWEYFRQAPLFQWPLGESPKLGPGLGSSIAMTDSIPLMAFLIKPLLFWYHGPFQYFGFWILVCFVMSGIASWKLLSIWIKDPLLRLTGCIFFVIAPAFLMRTTLHFALSAHWVLLLAFYLFFRPKSSFGSWLILGTVTALVQPYLLFMVSGVFLCSLFKQTNFWKNLLIYVGLVAFTSFQAGVFVFGISDIGAFGFGTFTANVYSFVDPGFPEFSRLPWSKIIPNGDQNFEQYEGFAFLGVGVLFIAVVVFICKTYWKRPIKQQLTLVLVLVPVACVAIFRDAYSVHLLFSVCIFSVFLHTLVDQLVDNRRRSVETVFLMIIYVLFSWSNHAVIGDRELYNFAIPKILETVFSISRISSRFIWVPMYLTITVLIVLAVKSLPKYFVFCLFIFALALQVFDTSSGAQFLRGSVERAGIESQLSSKTWNDFGLRYKKVKFVPAANKPEPSDDDSVVFNFPGVLWRDVGLLGLKFDWSLNSFYFGRSPDKNFMTENIDIDQSLTSGMYDPHTLYIFWHSEEWERAQRNVNHSDLIRILDGVPVLAPGFLD